MHASYMIKFPLALAHYINKSKGWTVYAYSRGRKIAEFLLTQFTNQLINFNVIYSFLHEQNSTDIL